MVRLSLTLILAAAPSLAHAQDRVPAMWDEFVASCSQIVEDPGTFITTLPVPGPAGEPVFYQTPDNKLLQIDTVVNGFVLAGQVFIVKDIESRDCTFSLNDFSGGSADLTRDAIRAKITAEFSGNDALTVIGGPVNKTIPSGAAPQPLLPVNDYDEYWFEGLVSGVETTGMATFGDGFVSLYLHRVIRRSDTR